AIAFRFFSAGLAFLAHVVFPNYQPEPFAGMWGVPSPFWDTFTRYDAGWYYQIARNGYEFVTGGPSVGVGKPGKIAYFPVYPYLIRFLSRFFGRTPADFFPGGDRRLVGRIHARHDHLVLSGAARFAQTVRRSGGAFERHLSFRLFLRCCLQREHVS